ncbi:MAG: IclR family transcriptional regulator domain-containing protein [Rhodobacterales bacterium]|jgi:IclR family acetate operon transcriptional repressor
MRCIAAPIKNAFGEVIAGISVSGPTSRVASDKVQTFAKSVINAAINVSAAMGADIE